MTKAGNKNYVISERVNKLEDNLKKYTLIGTLVGVLLGGGGVLGIAQWVYQAPLDKKIKIHESAMTSLKATIEALKSAGTAEEAQALRLELVALDRNYRSSLGLIVECMEILSSRGIDQAWLQKAAQKLKVLEQQRTLISEQALLQPKGQSKITKQKMPPDMRL